MSTKEHKNPDVDISEPEQTLSKRSGSAGTDIHSKDAPPELKGSPTAQWPGPAPLHADKVAEGFAIAYDAVLIAAPIALLVKAGLCIVARHLEARDINSGYFGSKTALTKFLTEFNAQLTTAFTILFVMIMSTLLRRYALYRAQSGAYVTTLEQYQASISLPSTLKTVISLRAWTLTSLVLVFVWCFYYLGSQASQREYGFRFNDAQKNFMLSIPRFNTTLVFNFDPDNSTITFMNDQFLADLHTDLPGGSAGFVNYDSNNHPLIPTIEQYDPMVIDKHGWSIVGLPGKTVFAAYHGLFSTNSFNVNIRGKYSASTSYFNISCQPFAFEAGKSLNLSTTMSLIMRPTDDDSERAAGGYARPRTFEFFSKTDGGLVHTTCGVRTATLDLQIVCDDTTSHCGVAKMKPQLTNGQVYSNRTPFDNTTLFNDFLNNLTYTSNLPKDNDSSTLLERYFEYQTTHVSDNLVNITDNERGNYIMQSAINTYYYLGMELAMDSNDRDQSDLYSEFSKLDGSVWYPHYDLDIPWLVLDFISCTILLVAAVLSAYLRTKILAPDIFGYVSTLTRDNPKLRLPEGGTTLSGLERARAMKNVKIRIGDVGDEEYGRVGVGLANGEDAPAQPRTEGRKYL